MSKIQSFKVSEFCIRLYYARQSDNQIRKYTKLANVKYLFSKHLLHVGTKLHSFTVLRDQILQMFFFFNCANKMKFLNSKVRLKGKWSINNNIIMHKLHSYLKFK
jgi:hypothetical protein